MKSGLIFFEDGEVQQFGDISNPHRMIQTAQETFKDLVKQQRAQLLQSITEDDMKSVIERIAKEKDSNAN